MKAFTKFLEIDQAIQLLLMLLAGLSAFTIIGLAVTMPLLGAWQVFSGIVGYYFLKDKEHVTYLCMSAATLACMPLCMIFDFSAGGFIVLMVFIIVPAFLAFYYYKLTGRTLEKVKTDYAEVYDPKEHLLDDELIWG